MRAASHVSSSNSSAAAGASVDHARLHPRVAVDELGRCRREPLHDAVAGRRRASPRPADASRRRTGRAGRTRCCARSARGCSRAARRTARAWSSGIVPNPVGGCQTRARRVGVLGPRLQHRAAVLARGPLDELVARRSRCPRPQTSRSEFDEPERDLRVRPPAEGRRPTRPTISPSTVTIHDEPALVVVGLVDAGAARRRRCGGRRGPRSRGRRGCARRTISTEVGGVGRIDGCRNGQGSELDADRVR